MLQGPRPPKSGEFNNLIEFLDNSLRKEAGWSIADEYPLAINPGNSNNMKIMTDDENIVAHALLKNIFTKSPAGLFKVATIGSVITDEKYRNKGYSQKVLTECITSATEQRCDFALLWTDLYGFYQKLGFELAGTEVSHVLNQPLPCPRPDLKVVEGNKIDATAIHRLFQKHTVHSLRSVEDTRKLLNIPNSKVFTAWSPTNELLSYAVIGKGADLENYIHEWGGLVDHFFSLVSKIQPQFTTPLTLISGAQSTGLQRRLSQMGVKSHLGFLGMIKILNPHQLLAKVHKYAHALGIDDLVLEKNGPEYILGRKGQVFKTDCEKDIVHLLFGPHKAGQIHEFDAETRQLLETVFPLPLWVWGWDSI